MREHKFLGGNRGNLCVKEFRCDSTSPVRGKQGWIREKRERLQGIAEGASSAPRLASSSAVSFPGRNECLGTYCSLIEQKEIEDSSCQICQRVCGRRKDEGEDWVARTERESDWRGRERADLLVLPRPEKSVQNGAGFSGKT